MLRDKLREFLFIRLIFSPVFIRRHIVVSMKQLIEINGIFDADGQCNILYCAVGSFYFFLGKRDSEFVDVGYGRHSEVFPENGVKIGFGHIKVSCHIRYADLIHVILTYELENAKCCFVGTFELGIP